MRSSGTKLEQLQYSWTKSWSYIVLTTCWNWKKNNMGHLNIIPRVSFTEQLYCTSSKLWENQEKYNIKISHHLFVEKRQHILTNTNAHCMYLAKTIGNIVCAHLSCHVKSKDTNLIYQLLSWVSTGNWTSVDEYHYISGNSFCCELTIQEYIRYIFIPGGRLVSRAFYPRLIETTQARLPYPFLFNIYIALHVAEGIPGSCGTSQHNK